ALVGGAGDRRADALAAAVAGVVEGAGVAVVAWGAVGLGGVRAQPRARVAHARVVALIRRRTGDGGAARARAALAGVDLRAAVAVVALGTVRDRRVVTSREIAGVRGAAAAVIVGRGVGQRIGHHRPGRWAVPILP